MITPLVWKSFENYCKLFGKLWRCPYDWDPVSRNIVTIEFTKKAIPWALVHVIYLFLAILPCGFLTVIEVFGSHTMSRMTSTINSCFFLMAMFAVVFDILAAMFFDKPVVLAAKSVVKLHAKLSRGKYLQCYQLICI